MPLIRPYDREKVKNKVDDPILAIRHIDRRGTNFLLLNLYLSTFKYDLSERNLSKII